jgi:16S rRNA (adenine1518-N6/adenine1519-N6)-dimethyltransferase
MQTKQQIGMLLSAAGLKPRRSRGQHFLVDLNLMRLLIESAGVTGRDVVLEVGCGTGSLTAELAEKAAAVVAVEADRGLARIAEDVLSESANVVLINADVLEGKHRINPRVTEELLSAGRTAGGRLLLVSNLPYNVASPVIANLIEGPVKADGMYVTVQHEAAVKMTAHPGAADYGALSILMAATGAARIFRVLKPSVFWPPPKVYSAMVSFEREPEKASGISDFRLFAETVRLLLGHRRKTVASCAKLAGGRLRAISDWSTVFESCKVSPSARGQELAAEKFIEIANACAARLK